VLHAIRAEHGIRFDSSHGRPRNVVVVGTKQSGMLGRLPAHEGGARLGAGPRDAVDDRRDSLGNDLAARDVVRHEQRLRADHDDVVDDHADEVLADRVVLVERLGDRDLGAHAIRARREQRMPEVTQRAHVEQAGESAHAAQHLGPVGASHGCLHQLDGSVTRRGIDSCCGVAVGGTGHVLQRTQRALGVGPHACARLRRTSS
jgi:hypothetical protein